MIKEELFYLDEDKSYAVLLGYIMPLTKSEFRILKLISVNSGYTSCGSIMENLFSGKAITDRNVSVHVCMINSKARKISGRNLIEGKRFKGYKIVDKI